MSFDLTRKWIMVDTAVGSSRVDRNPSTGALPARGGAMDYSQHALWRCAQRNLALDDVHYILFYGSISHKAGAVIYFLRDRDVPRFDRADNRRMRLVGTAVVCSPDGRTVVAVWRNRKNGLGKIKRKLDRSQRPA